LHYVAGWVNFFLDIKKYSGIVNLFFSKKKKLKPYRD